MKHYYAIEFWGNRNTTTGSANPRTGRMSIACDIAVFNSRAVRDKWLIASYSKNERIPATRRECRDNLRGMPIAAFNEYIENLTQR